MLIVKRLIRFFILLLVKLLNKTIYPTTRDWIGNPAEKNWQDVRLIVLLNHTSLFEYIYAGLIPPRFLWKMTKDLIFPVADVTYKRPFMRGVLKCLGPNPVSISRKKDSSWDDFLKQIKPSSIMIFLPEGRMKRKTGLDKEGNPMTMKGGICDVMEKFQGHKMVLVYSKGLHHILAPGELFPKPHRSQVSMEVLDIASYTKSFRIPSSGKIMKSKLCEDLEKRRDRYC